jgi:hypothetical protein
MEPLVVPGALRLGRVSLRNPAIARNVICPVVRAMIPKYFRSRFTICVTFLALTGLADLRCLGQPRPQPTPAATNLWLKTPIPWDPKKDLVDHDVRSLRDAYFDATHGSATPLTHPDGNVRAESEGSSFPPPPEIPLKPGQALLMAQFSSYSTVLSSSERTIYTEGQFHVENVFVPSSSAVTPGSDITLEIAGGAVRLGSGQVISYLTSPRRYFLQPGRLYLLILEYHPRGDFYIAGKSWDLTDGSVRENSSQDAGRVASRSSDILGRSIGDMINYLNSRFSTK